MQRTIKLNGGAVEGKKPHGKTRTARDALILAHRDQAHILAAQYIRKTGVCRDELLSAAYEGLVVAAGKWDKTKGKFRTYAEQVIKGHILDCVRFHVGRHKGTMARSTYLFSDLENSMRYKDSNSEIDPGYLGNGYVFDGPREILLSISGEDKERENGELWDTIKKIVGRYGMVIYSLYHVSGFTMQQVADHLRVSESRVSQIMNEMDNKLKRSWRFSRYKKPPMI